MKTAAHELTHFIQANSAQYEALKSFVVNKLTHEEGVSFEDLVADKQRREPGLEYDEAVDEVVADACEMMLGDSTVVEQLAKENRSLAKKIRDWLREWVENLKIALEGLQADRTESRAMMQYARELQEIWDNALMDAAGVPHCRWAAASRADLALNGPVVLDAVEAKLGYPIFVKPANAGSSVGISKAADRAMLEQAVEIALREDDKVVFEEFVDAQEVECAAIGNPDDPSTVATTRPGEILAGAEFYTYDDKYKNGVSQTVIPAHLSEEKLDEVQAEARKAYLALNCAGLSRCDFFVERGTGRVLCNELNTLPGFTPISMYPKLMEHEGYSYPALVDKLLQLALHRRKGAY